MLDVEGKDIKKILVFLDGKVAAGDKSKGDLTYQVSASQKSFTLAFEADLLSSGQTVWDLSI
jgi:hypothetical protein